jgi:hypothetical protein
LKQKCVFSFSQKVKYRYEIWPNIFISAKYFR